MVQGWYSRATAFFRIVRFSCGLLLIVSVGEIAFAETTDTDTSHRVLMSAFGTSLDEMVIQAVRAGLSDTRVVFEVSRPIDDTVTEEERVNLARSVAGKKSVMFVFWIEESTAPKIRFLIPQSDGEIMETRQLGVAGSVVSQSETAAILVLRMTLALAMGTKQALIESNGTDAASKIPEDALPRRPRISFNGAVKTKPHRLLAELVLRNTVLSKAHPSLLGGRLTLGVGLAAGFGLLIGYTFTESTVDDKERVRLSVHRRPMDIVIQYQMPVPRGRFRLVLRGGVEVDFLDATTYISTDEFRETSNDNPPEISLTAAVAGVIHIVGPTCFVVGVGFRTIISESRFTMETNTGKMILLDSWTVQPDITAGLLFKFFLKKKNHSMSCFVSHRYNDCRCVLFPLFPRAERTSCRTFCWPNEPPTVMLLTSDDSWTECSLGSKRRLFF